MTPEIARDMIDYLTSRYATDPQVQRWLDSINVYVVGSVNPDGAMYVFTTDPSWRKNRRPSCAVDNNRNYPVLWGSCNGSSATCSAQDTRGTAPGSEPETQGLVSLTSQVRPFFALSYHSYGEYIMYSYGCNDPDERAALDEVAQGLNAILPNDNGATGQYATGPIWSTIYLADGGSVDTQYNQHGAYAYVIEVNSSAAGGFQPSYATWRNLTVQRQRNAWKYFLDKTLDGAQIRGKVTDAGTGLPLAANLEIQEVTFTHGEAPRHADSKGNYRLLVQSGQTYHVRYAFPGYCTATREIAVGSGPQSADVALGQPGVPQGVGASAGGDNAIDVAWQPAANAQTYRIYRALDPGGPFVLLAEVPAAQTSYHDAPVSGGVTYRYVVRAVQGCESADSAVAQAATTGPCTAGPSFAGLATVTNAAASTCTLNLSWPAAAARCGGGVTYRVHRSAATPLRALSRQPRGLRAHGHVVQRQRGPQRCRALRLHRAGGGRGERGRRRQHGDALREPHGTTRRGHLDRQRRGLGRRRHDAVPPLGGQARGRPHGAEGVRHRHLREQRLHLAHQPGAHRAERRQPLLRLQVRHGDRLRRGDRGGGHRPHLRHLDQAPDQLSLRCPELHRQRLRHPHERRRHRLLTHDVHACLSRLRVWGIAVRLRGTEHQGALAPGQRPRGGRSGLVDRRRGRHERDRARHLLRRRRHPSQGSECGRAPDRIGRGGQRHRRHLHAGMRERRTTPSTGERA
jgi:hypothetical protein